MRSRLAAVAAALVLSLTGVTGEPVPSRVDDTPQIAFEVQVLTLPESDFFDRVGIDFEMPKNTPMSAPLPGLPEGGVLTDSQVRTLLEAVQGDRRANVVMAPKVTVENGRDASIQCTQRQTFVTGVDAMRAKGGDGMGVKGDTVLIPRNTAMDVGEKLNLGGRIAADRKAIVARVQYTNTRVEKVDLIPVTSKITPIFEGASQGVPVPVTHYIQSPQIETTTIEKKDLTIPAGCHAVLVGPEVVREARQEFGPPVLSKIPYVNRMFKNVGLGRETVRTVLIVTPRVLESK
jgi:type II secretory pathway component GspD/PulD (secretin)